MSDIRVKLTLEEDASQKLQKVTSAGKQAEAAMKQAGTSMDNAFKGKGLDKLASDVGRAIQEIMAEFDGLGEDFDSIMDDFTSGFEEGFKEGFADSFDEARQAAEDLGDTFDDVGERMDDAADSAEELGDATEDLGKGSGLDDLGRDAEDAGRSMGNASTKAIDLGKAVKGLIAAVAGAKVLKEIKNYAMDSIELGKGFTSMMSEVQAISGASAEEIAQLEATAREYGATTVFSASEAAEALKYMSLAGWNAQQSSSALGGVLDLAAASGMGLGQASDMVTDYLSAFGMEASQASYFADMLAYAQSNSNTTAEQLGQAYLNSAANLHAAGQDVETTTSLLEAMANQGTKGSRAGTQLAAIARDITNAMEDGKIMIGETAIEVADAEGNFRDYTDVLTDVGKAVDGMGTAQRAAALATTFTADSTKGINQILNEGMDNISGYEEALRNAGGTASETADIMNDNLKGDMANMNSAWEEMQLRVFEGMEEPLRAGVQYITSTVIPLMTEWVPVVFEALAGYASKIGNALKPIFETILKNPKQVASAFAALGTGMAVFKGGSIVSNLLGAAEGTTKLTGALGSLGTALVAHPWLAAGAAIAGSILLIKTAYDSYRDEMTNASLTANFGTVDLSPAQVSEMAGKIVGVDWVANINLALGEFQNAEEFHEQAEQALRDNEALLWEARVQTTLDKAEGNDPVSEYVSSIQGLLDGKKDDNGLEFTANVPTSIEPDKTDQQIADQLVELVNMGVNGVDKGQMEEFAATVATQIDPDGDPGALAQDLVDWANEVVKGADGEKLEDINDEVTVNLDPKESTTWYSALNRVVSGMTKTKLENPPEWEEDLTIKLTPKMQEDYKANLETYVDSKVEELKSTWAASKTAMETVVGDQMGSAILAEMATWQAEESSELTGLSESLTKMAQSALEDGMLSVEEQTAIDILQRKINNIFSEAASLQADAEWKALQTKWGARDLTADSFVEVLEDARKQRQTAIDSLDETSVNMYAEFERWHRNGHLGEYGSEEAGKKLEQIEQLWGQSYLGQKGEAIGRSISFATGELMSKDAYKSLIDTNLQSISDNGGGATIDLLNRFAESGGQEALNDIINGMTLSNARNFWSENGSHWWDAGSEEYKNYGAMQEMYDAMKPDVAQMGEIIDAYRNDPNVKEIPKAITDAYYDAIKMGAAVGDEGAAWDYYAQQMLETGGDSLKDALKNEDNPLYQTLRDQMAPELQAAVDRAIFAEDHAVENVDLSEMFNQILGLSEVDGEIDLSKLQEIFEEAGLDISEYLADHPIEADGSGAKIDLKDFNPEDVAGSVKQLDGMTVKEVLDDGIKFEIAEGTPTVWSIASQLVDDPSNDSQIAQAAQQILDANGWTEADARTLMEGQEVIIPAELAVDKEALDASAADAAEDVQGAAEELKETAEDAAGGTDIDVHTDGTVDGDYSAGEAAGAQDAGKELDETAKELAEESQPEPADKEIPASITINLQSLDDTALSEGISTALAESESTIPVTVPADVTISVGSVDSSGLSTGIETALGGEDGAGSVPVTAPADVTVSVGNVDDSAAVEDVTSTVVATFETAIPTPGTVDVTLAKGQDNIDAVYNAVGSDVRSAFSQGYSASARVNVTLTADYSLANPTKTITFGGGATGSATVTASLHAAGGIFDQPHFGVVAEAGPEAIIPLDGSADSLDLWKEAGKMMGLEEAPLSISPGNLGSGDQQGGGTGGSREVNVNINGNGSIKVSGGVSKEQVVELILENAREALLNIVEQEIFEEGDAVYEY